MKSGLDLSEDVFKLFQELLIEESGLYFNKDNITFFCAAVNERMEKHKFNTYLEYYNYIKFHTNKYFELCELFDLITVGETHFYRNRPQIESLIEFILPDMIKRKTYSKDKSIRIWSAACSKGDEPYTIAMAIMEVLPSYKDWDICILGTDINRIAINAAKEAIFNKKDINQLPEPLLNKYFIKRDAEYILSKSVKDLVSFERHNLATEAYSSEKMQNLDLIFCRNVIIYFDSATTKRVIESFYYNLKSDGYLFLGDTESLWQVTDKFCRSEFPQAFVYKKATTGKSKKEIVPFISIPEIKLQDYPSTKKIQIEEKTEPVNELKQLYKEAVIEFNNKKYENALSVFDKIIAQDMYNIPSYFAQATILANQEKYTEAINLLTKIIELDSLFVDAHYFLGVLLDRDNNLKGAEAQFKKVIYIDPEIVLAYFNLGNIYLCQENYNNALREYNNAVNLLGKNRDKPIKFCQDLSAENILRACKNNIQKIREKGWY